MKPDPKKQYEDSAKESISVNPDTFKPKTMDMVLNKIKTLEDKTEDIKKTVHSIKDLIMPNSISKKGGMYNDIEFCKEAIGDILKTMELEKERRVVEDHESRIKKLEEKVSKVYLFIAKVMGISIGVMFLWGILSKFVIK